MRRVIFCLGLIGFLLPARADPLPKTFSHPTRIRYDGQCLSLEDQDVFIFSAEFDYFQSPRPLWRDRFRALKGAGYNAVDTSVPANAAGLQDWLRMAQGEFGFYTIVCPEAAGLAGACPPIAAEQITRQAPGHPGVILVRIAGGDLRSLNRTAIAGGVEVPIFTEGSRECRGSADAALGRIFDSVTLSSPVDLAAEAGDLADLESTQVDAPLMISELQGAPAVLVAVENGATILETTGDTTLAATALGAMLQARGAAFARSFPCKCQAETGNPQVVVTARRTREGATYLFLRNRSVSAPAHGTAAIWLQGKGEAGVDYTLAPAACKILYLAPGARWPFDSGRNVRSQGGQTGVAWLP